MAVLRIRGRALTELAEDRFDVRVEEVADAGFGVKPGDIVSLRVSKELVVYWIGHGDVEPGTGVEAAIVAPLTDGEPADTLDLQLNSAVLEGLLSE